MSSSSANDRLRELAPLPLMIASGFAGLGYQLVWTQQCALWLGHESAAVLAVVAAFFGGLSAGAWWLGQRIELSSHPARWYAACEALIAAWSLLLVFALPSFSAWLLRVLGERPNASEQWALAFFGTFLLLLPATAAMGATLPAMERITARWRGEGRGIAGLYAANTFGAVLGVLVSACWTIPAFGLSRSALGCSALNLACAATSLALFPARVPIERQAARSDRALLVQLSATGLLGIGYEVLVVRVLSQVTESTVYTFAALLAVYLVGSAIGAAAYQRFQWAHEDLGDRLLAALVAACAWGTTTLFAAERLKAYGEELLGEGVSSAILAEAAPALFAFAPATIVMGALFSHLARRASASGVGFSRALAVNTLGAAVAPALFGVWLAPALGPKTALLLVCAGYLALVTRRAWSRPLVWLPAAATLALALWAPPLAFVEVPEGGHVVSYQDGATAAVSVVEDADGVKRLRINDRAQEGSSRSQRVDGRQAWLPLLLGEKPKHALFLGLGTGVTAASAAADSSLEVDAVELLPEVIAASTYFADSVDEGAHARLRVVAADARRYVRASKRTYDVIIADNYHPARSGSGSLYTVEHFQAVRDRLTRHGLFCQWLPLHQLDRETLRSIVQSFLAVYPEGTALIASNSLETPVLGLIGHADAWRVDPKQVQARLAEPALAERIARIGLEDELAVLGSFVAGPTALRRLAGQSPGNTDDRPIVAYHAPRATYAPRSSPGERLIALLHELSLTPSELLSAPLDAELARRLSNYWQARDRFIESGRAVRPSAEVTAMLAQVREPLLGVLRLSPEFRPAYDPLFAMAGALARSDASAARALLGELASIQPARSEAPRALAQLVEPPRH